MRRFLSWVVFFLSMFVIIYAANFLLALLVVLLNTFKSTNVGADITERVGIAPQGVTLFVAILASVYVIPLAIKLSETVCPSRTGVRYLVYAIILLALNGISLILCLIKFFDFSWIYVFCVIIAIALLFMYKKRLGDTFRRREDLY